MAKLTKKQKEAQSKIEKGKAYTVAEASALITFCGKPSTTEI